MKETDKQRFERLMNSWEEPSQEELEKEYIDAAEKRERGEEVVYKKPAFTNEEVIFMWHYDTVAFAKKFPGVAEYYILYLER